MVDMQPLVPGKWLWGRVTALVVLLLALTFAMPAVWYAGCAVGKALYRAILGLP